MKGYGVLERETSSTAEKTEDKVCMWNLSKTIVTLIDKLDFYVNILNKEIHDYFCLH